MLKNASNYDIIILLEKAYGSLIAHRPVLEHTGPLN